MAKLKTTPLELQVLLNEKNQLDMAKQRIINGEKQYKEMVKQNDEKLKLAEQAFNNNLSMVAGKKINYLDATFSEEGIEVK